MGAVGRDRAHRRHGATLDGGAPSGERSAAAGAALMTARIGLLVASLTWAIGSLWSRRLPLPSEAALATAMEMLTAGPVLVVVAAVSGEWGHFRFAAVAPSAGVALAYLGVF